MLQTEFILEKEQTGTRVHLYEAHSKELDRWIAVRVDRNSEVCGNCLLIEVIDTGLAEIGQTNKEVMADDKRHA